MNPSKKMTAVVFSNFNFYSSNVVKTLIKKNIEVNIVTDNIKKWNKNYKRFSKDNFRISGTEDYIIYLCGFKKSKNAEKEYYSFFKNGISQTAKTLILFPSKAFPVESGNIYANNSKIGIVYVQKGAKIGETILNWLTTNGPYGKETFIKKTPKKRKSNKWLKYTLFTFFLILLFPLIAIIISSATTYFSVRLIYSDKVSRVRSAVSVSQGIIFISQKESNLLSRTPVVGKIYQETDYVSRFIISLNQIEKLSIYVSEGLSEILKNTTNENTYDLNKEVNKISENIFNIRKNLEFLETSKVLAQKFKINELVNKLQKGEELFNQAPDILGMNGTKKYLVVFVNNQNLRPAGGVIESFGIVTFEGGKVSAWVNGDTKTSDSYLKGHIDPPPPLLKYLNKKNWLFRDSGWSPYFPDTAIRMEWFLDKEIDQKVDGVLSIDLTAKNEISKLLADKNKYSTKTFTSIFKNLDSKHVQVFLHNASAQENISILKWSEGEPEGVDFVIPIESNMGDNNANKYITRSTRLEMSKNSGHIYHSLIITIKNSANSVLGERGTYKVYFNVNLPHDALFLGSKKVFVRGEESLETDSNLGSYFEVLPGTEKKIEYKWRTKDYMTNSYPIYIGKQAGTTSDSFTLTMDGMTVYNSSLDQSLWIK